MQAEDDLLRLIATDTADMEALKSNADAIIRPMNFTLRAEMARYIGQNLYKRWEIDIAAAGIETTLKPQYIRAATIFERFFPETLTKLAEALRVAEGFDKLGSADEYYEYYARSDHYEFAKLKDKNGNPIPIVFLTSGTHPDYHRPSDDSDKINYPKLARTARLIVRMLAELQVTDLQL